jgi:hypothetical protein
MWQKMPEKETAKCSMLSIWLFLYEARFAGQVVLVGSGLVSVAEDISHTADLRAYAA